MPTEVVGVDAEPDDPKPRTVREYTPEFEEFWQSFPVRDGKWAAFDKSWRKLRAEDRQPAIEGAKLFADRVRNEKIEKPKWAQGWLTERRWEDELQRASVSPSGKHLAWWQKPEVVATVDDDGWDRLIEKHANGIWPIDKLGWPPADPRHVVPDSVIARHRLLDLYDLNGMKRGGLMAKSTRPAAILSTKRAKAALQALPVMTGGVAAVAPTSARIVADATKIYIRSLDLDIHAEPRRVGRIHQAGMWVTYKLTPLTLVELSPIFNRDADAMGALIGNTDRRIRLRDHCTLQAIDGILRLLDGRVAIDLPEPAPARDEPRGEEPVLDPKWAEAKKLRKIGWTYKGITKRTGLPEDDVARFCGVEINRERV